MSTNIMSACKQCRVENTKLFLKGDRCLSAKCPIVKRKKTLKTRKSKSSYYGIQLREKQKLKRFYGLSESQFKKYYEISSHAEGNTGEMLVQRLERRLDNVIYRAGFAVSRSQARQMVSHGLFSVNNVVCNIPSFIVSKNDVITLREHKRKIMTIESNLEREYQIPQWIEKQDNFNLTIVNYPVREDMKDLEIKEQLIIELYSK